LQHWIGVCILLIVSATLDSQQLQRINRWCKREGPKLGLGVLAPPGILQAIKKCMALIQGRHIASFPQTYLSEYNDEIRSDCWPLYLASHPNQSLEMDRSDSANFLNFCIRHIRTMMEQDKPPPQFTADEW
jgi:hypothetical protein